MDTLNSIEEISDEVPPMQECAFCELPVPMEAGEVVYCDNGCLHAHVDEAIQVADVEESMVEIETTPPLTPLHLLFDLTDKPFPPLPHGEFCSCHYE